MHDFTVTHGGAGIPDPPSSIISGAGSPPYETLGMNKDAAGFSDFTHRVQASNDLAALAGGLVSHSARLYGPEIDAVAELPAGLHLSCAIARGAARSDKYGGFQSSGAILSALFVDEGGARFETSTAQGPLQSFSYFLPLDALDQDDPVLRMIVNHTKGRPLLTFDGPALGVVPRLTAQLRSEVAAIRATFLQARGLELAATVAACFENVDSRVSASGALRHAHRVRDDIEANLSQSNRLDEVAQRNNLGVRTMTAGFRSTFGESIGEYLLRRRMEVAASALEGGASVHEAAYLVGYTPNAFSRAFKDYFNVNPSQIKASFPVG